MPRRSRNRTTAWLGLFAIWLVVFAPVASQWLASHGIAEPAALHAMHHAEMDAHAAGGQMPAHHHLGACGYCDLLTHHVPAPSVAAPQVFAAVVHVTVRPAPAPDLVLCKTFPAGRQRDPPRSA